MGFQALSFGAVRVGLGWRRETAGQGEGLSLGLPFISGLREKGNYWVKLGGDDDAEAVCPGVSGFCPWFFR